MTESGRKKCPMCGEDKPLSNFGRRFGRKKHLWKAYCRPCSAKYESEWRRKSARYRRAASTRQRRGFTPEQAAELLRAQGNVCGICAAPSPGKKDWHADHDHRTGKIRGMLCGNCNRGIGYLRDDPRILQEAIDYLRRHSAG